MTDLKEYIEREALLQELEEVGGCDAPPDSWADGFDKGILSAIKHVEAQPAADVVEVVRCKDCEIPHNRFTGCPNLNGLIPPENHFCSYGKRKDGDGE